MESATSSSSEDITTRPWMCGDQAPIKLLTSSHVTEQNYNEQNLLCTCVYGTMCSLHLPSYIGCYERNRQKKLRN